MRQWMIDAFASAPFKGNPACVVEPFDRWPDDAWMQALAQENNQAETAFLLKTGDPARFGLRWFTPAVEVPLCGHATLASGHTLFAELGLDVPAVTFETKSGPLIVTRRGERYEMDFPADPPRPIPTPAGLAEALGMEPVETWTSQFVMAVLPDEAAVRALKPEPAAILAVSSDADWGPGHVCATAQADAGAPYDVVSRFFGPGSGINEDPTTGGTHTVLSPLWSATLGRTRLKFHQAFPGRGGDLECEHKGDRVLIAGRAVTVLEGRLRV